MGSTRSWSRFASSKRSRSVLMGGVVQEEHHKMIRKEMVATGRIGAVEEAETRCVPCSLSSNVR